MSRFRMLFVSIVSLATICASTSDSHAKNEPKALAPIQTSEDLPAPGHCPESAPQPVCTNKLNFFRTAYRKLVAKTVAYRVALDAAFDRTNWTQEVVQQVKALSDAIEALSKAAASMNEAVNTKKLGLKSKNYAVKLHGLAPAKLAYEQALRASAEAPAKPATDALAIAVTTTRDAYYKALREVYQSAASHSGLAGDLVELGKLVTATSTAIANVRTKYSAGTQLTDYAAAMHLRQPNAETEQLAAAYGAAKAALAAAMNAGASFGTLVAKKSGQKGGVIILDAFYGASEVIADIYENWKEGGEKAEDLMPLVPHDAGLSVCQAKSYAKSVCEYTRIKYELCEHKNLYSKGPDGLGGAATIGECDDANYTLNKTTYWRHHRYGSPICDLAIKPDNVCGGRVVTATSNDRSAFILYKCGAAGKVKYKPAANNQRVYLICD